MSSTGTPRRRRTADESGLPSSSRPNRRARVESVPTASQPDAEPAPTTITLPASSNRRQSAPLPQPFPMEPPATPRVPAATAPQPAAAAGPARAPMPPIEIPPPAVQDPHFYKMDGNVIIRVEDTLFKVHRHYLAPEAEQTLFEGLLAIAFEESEGDSDDRPLVLVGDTVDDLRAYLRFAYSSPLQLRDENITQADLAQLAIAGRFANRYNLESFQQWVRLVLKAKINADGGAILRTCPTDTYLELFRFNKLCGADDLTRKVQDVWRQRIFGDGDAVADLTIPEGGGSIPELRAFFGELYYTQLLRCNESPHAQAVPPTDTTTLYAPVSLAASRPGLSFEQRLRLLEAHRSLTLSFARIADHLLYSLHLCTNQHCETASRCHDAWRTAVRSMLLPSTDRVDYRAVLGNLGDAVDGLGMCTDTKNRAADVLREIQREFERGLADHFLGPAV
ncbi:BTB domain-containing protein [Mycena kentingensis (nom. inval.)]|nr:BTB domain-containing protein [Mycena kentingensis (nom. inval.)]